MCDFPPNFRSPLGPSSGTTGRTQKVKVGPKMVRTCCIYMLSLVTICRRTAAREENECFFVCCLFACLSQSVYLWAIVAIYWSILMQFSAFLEQKRPVEFFKNILTTPQDGATFVLELGQN